MESRWEKEFFSWKLVLFQQGYCVPSIFCTGNLPKSGRMVLYFDLRPEQNDIQGDAPKGSDTFQWQLCEEIAWRKLADEMGRAKKNPMVHS